MLRDGDYQPRIGDPLSSEVLGLGLCVVDGMLRLRDPATGLLLPTPREEGDRSRAEAARADTEAARADTEAARADTEAARADTEAARADAEARARAEAEQRLAALEASLRGRPD